MGSLMDRKSLARLVQHFHSAAAMGSVFLLVGHDPDAIPTFAWRMLAQVLTTFDVEGGKLVIRVTFKSFTKLTDRFLEVRGTVVLDTIIEAAHDIHDVGKGVVRVVVEYLINRDRFRFPFHDHLVDVE